MNKLKLFSLLFVMLMTVSVSAKKNHENKGVYIAGVSASFSDSIVYITDISYVEKAVVTNTMLENREQYSAQLQDYFSAKDPSSYRTCCVFFNGKKKSLVKQMKKMKERYMKGKSVLVMEVPDFKFTEVEEY